MAPCEIVVVVTSCERPPELARLLQQLDTALRDARWDAHVRLIILEDAAEADYGPVQREFSARFAERLVWLRSTRRLGKRGYWLTYQAGLRLVESSGARLALFIQDDLELCEGALVKARKYLEELARAESAPVVLNLYASGDDEPGGRWVKFERKQHAHLPVRKTQWFDLNGYLIERSALLALRFQLVPIHSHRWQADATLSSGVGRQLTRRLAKRAAIYQCFPPLVLHGKSTSLMNPEARAARSLDNYAIGTQSKVD